MPDFDIQKEISNGGIKGVFVAVIMVSISVTIGYQWQSYFKEVIEQVFPLGHGLLEKFVINIVMTLILVGFIILISRKKKPPEVPKQTDYVQH